MNVVSIPDLPVEIVVDILSRLRARNVLRFRCVSKSWKSLIDSSYFIDMHHNRSIHTCSSKDLFFSNIDFYSYRLNNSDIISEIIVRDQRFLVKSTEILGFVNGLYLLRDYRTRYFILNTSTREYKELPDVPFEDVIHHGFGFCYDSINKDYKVVLLIYEKFDHTFAIYSLKSNSWRRIEGITLKYWSTRAAKGVVVNGALHWQNVEMNKIVAFDIRTEEYRIFPSPEDPDFVYDYIEKLEEHLSIIRYDRNHNTACLWMMMDYGVNKSWTKLLSISSREGPDGLIIIWSLCYSKDRNEILFLEAVDEGQMILSYDLSKQTTKALSVDAVSMVAHACASIENLVKLSGYGKEKKNFNRKKRRRQK